ncbi:enoyl-CoA hydratase [Didymella exigua CBS 183.55]|uniref:Enoyl-CoA hydratase n=1 Tax=Didymella exigua CBS 183.55 TaxID=1150837 RepID=A0A6A5RS30_9PLEO|nr:enoyl-CoA hydratase [Didymella exigua CBS 183.55]KAF1929864.1 enoyl-CoA hydratase [Didymella exigua CBS 183.55]
MTQSGLIVLSREGNVAIVKLNRPEKRNALSQELIDELIEVLSETDKDASVRVVILTGSEQGPFSAGADLAELAHISTAQAFQRGWLKDLNDSVDSFRKPIIAAVRGFAFGGGFELALLCDMIYAAVDARFGFPEINLGTIPGMGGTQRLSKTVGKQKALEMILTGLPVTAREMEQRGVVNKVVDGDVLEEALRVAQLIAARSAPALRLAKHAVKTAENTTLEAGLAIERASYYGSFSFVDCREGIAAFLEKRPAAFLED